MLGIWWPSVCGKDVTCCSFVGRESNADYQPATTTTTTAYCMLLLQHKQAGERKPKPGPSWKTGKEEERGN